MIEGTIQMPNLCNGKVDEQKDIHQCGFDYCELSTKFGPNRKCSSSDCHRHRRYVRKELLNRGLNMFRKENSNNPLIEKLLSIKVLPEILLMVIGSLLIINGTGIMIFGSILCICALMFVFLLHKEIIIIPSNYLVGYMENCLPEVIYDFEHAKDDKDKKYFGDKIKLMVEFRERSKYWRLKHPEDEIVNSY